MQLTITSVKCARSPYGKQRSRFGCLQKVTFHLDQPGPRWILLDDEQHHMQDLEAWLKELGGRRPRGYGRYGNRRRGALQDRASF